jgi:hypothetical protein
MRDVSDILHQSYGVLSNVFRPTRGIRQGDPISPYLFLLCAEGLSCLLRDWSSAFVQGAVRVGVHSPWISHLLFADDCIIFFRSIAEGGHSPLGGT